MDFLIDKTAEELSELGFQYKGKPCIYRFIPHGSPTGLKFSELEKKIQDVNGRDFECDTMVLYFNPVYKNQLSFLETKEKEQLVVVEIRGSIGRDHYIIAYALEDIDEDFVIEG